MKNIKTYILISIFSAGIAGLATYGGFYLANKEKIETGEKFSIIKECRDILEKNCSEFNDEDAVIGAINGYLQNGGDKYTYYYQFYNSDPVKDSTNYINTSGTAIASGFQVQKSDDGNVLITEIIPNLAADKQGLKTGDIITHIDGISISEKGFENYANKILGKQDTKVELTINRDGEIFKMTFKRDNELIREVNWEWKGDVAYIKISTFEMLSAGNMSTAMNEVGDAEKFIIDLRNNRGGQNEYMIQAVDYFAGEGEVIMNGNNGETEIYTTNPDAVDAKIIILINEKTASAAEIFTALCKQYGKDVTLVGMNTFGKGIFQKEAILSDGGKLHYTAGYFTVGDWECWHSKGITPDIIVEMDSSFIDTEDDIQFKKALELLE